MFFVKGRFAPALAANALNYSAHNCKTPNKRVVYIG